METAVCHADSNCWYGLAISIHWVSVETDRFRLHEASNVMMETRDLEMGVVSVAKSRIALMDLLALHAVSANQVGLG